MLVVYCCCCCCVLLLLLLLCIVVVVVIIVVVVVELHVTVHCIKILLHDNAFIVNLCYRQQCKLYLKVYEGIYNPTNLQSLTLYIQIMN